MTINEETSKNNINAAWLRFRQKHPTAAQFVVFFILSNGVTILQLLLMPILRNLMSDTSLTYTAFQALPIGHEPDGSQYFIFNYEAGPIRADGSGGGLAYFLAVQITLAIAQIINFFAQRNITFKSNTSIAKAAFWYFAAYVAITLAAAALQGFYKDPMYDWLIGTLGSRGEFLADMITMMTNATISFVVFFPIFRLIFKRK